MTLSHYLGNLLKLGFGKWPAGTPWCGIYTAWISAEGDLYLPIPELKPGKSFLIKRAIVIHSCAGVSEGETQDYYTIQLKKGDSNVGSALDLMTADMGTEKTLYTCTYPTASSAGSAEHLSSGEFLKLVITATGTPTSGFATILIEGILN
ncbi:MAG: hypothetical protein ABIN54_09085 [candidate division WOR-3 bacterium]